MPELKFDQEKYDAQMKAANDVVESLKKDVEALKSAGVPEIKSFQEKLDKFQDTVGSLEMIGNVKTADFIANLEKSQVNIEKELKSLKETKGIKEDSLQDHIKGLVKSDDFANSIKSKQGGTYNVKAANDILTSDWTADTGTVGLPQMDIPGVSVHPWKSNPIYAAIQKRTVAMDHELRYTEELSRSDAAALKAEGSQYAQSGATWISKKLGFFDIGHFMKESRENMEDAEYAREAINNLLYNGLLRALEYKLLNGVGTTDIEGLAVAAQTFAKPLGLQPVASAKMADVLRAAKLFVAKGINATASTDTNKKGYAANVALVGPASIANMELEKDEIGRRYMEGGERPAGMSLLESQDLTETVAAQNFLVGDFSKAVLYLKRNLIIETGFDGNDFTYGMMTLRASICGNMLVKSLDKYAFVYGDFATAPGFIS